MVRFTSDRWSSLTSRLQLRASSDIFEKLRSRYSEASRRYHTLQHIDDCLAQLDGAPPIAEHPYEVEFAIWLHDVVYDTHRTDNEAMSARLAAEILRGAACDADVVNRIVANIIATAHQAPISRIDERLIVDIDLSILGRTATEYDRYETAIRDEYDWVPWRTYCEKRIELLRSFLDRDQIYLTDFFSARYEASARSNLTRAIGHLARNAQQ